MRRRQFIALLGGAAATWPLVVRGQQSPIRIVGFMHSASADFLAPFIPAFKQGLKQAGYIDGQNVTIEFRWAEGHYDRLPTLVSDLISRNAAVIVAAGGPAPARAVMAATTTIPIVFVSATDPVAVGLVASLSRPGGNVTGVSLIGSTLEAKRLELLHELVPKASTLAVLMNPNYPGAKIQSQEVQDAAAQLGMKVVAFNTATEPDIEGAFASLAQQGAAALVVAQDATLFAVERDHLVALAARHSIPTIYWQKEFATAGGLISYAPDFADGYLHAGDYAGRILKGERPADLPVMQPTKFELVINLKTAKVLGLTVPPTLLARADEVIE